MLKEWREQRSKLVHDMRGIIDRAQNEKRALTAEENAQIARMKTDAENLKQSILNVEEIEAEERAAVPDSQRQARKVDQPAQTSELRKFLMADPRTSQARQSFDLLPEQRAQNTLTLAGGGAVVAPDTSMYGRIVEALKWFGGMEAVGAEVYTTDTGADMPIATDNDTSNVGAIVAEEGSQAGGSNVTMGQVVLHSYLYSSKVVKVSWQLLQDASFDIESYLGRKLGMRLARIQNTHFTTGTGVNQPQGLVTGATVGRQSATGNTTSVVADDVLRLIRSVDPAYLQNAKFMMSSSSALQYELLKDGNGQYLWRDGAGFGGLKDVSGFAMTAGTLRGFPVVLNNDMPTMAASAKHTSFGDHSYYKIRRVKAIQIVRINELYVENGQVGFLAFMRADGGLVDAGQNPVKLLQNSAS
jgi:HK97 family phage major capsid protein